MSVRDALLRNTFWYGIVTVLGLAMGMAMSVVLARWLGPAQMGEYSYILWAARTLTAVATLGFALGTIRYTATALAANDPELAWGVVMLMRRRQIVAAALVCAVTIPLIVLAAPAGLVWPLVLVCVALFPITLEHVYSHAVYGAQRYDRTAMVSTVKMALQLVGAIAALALGFGILGLVVTTLAGTMVAAWLQRRSALELYPDRAARVPDEMRAEMRAYLVPLSLVVVLDALVWDRSEVFFLKLSATSQDIAFYSLAFGLATKAMVLPEIAVGALLPTFSALHGRGAPAEFARVYRSAIRYVALAAIPIAAISIGVAPMLIAVLYGDEYQPVAGLFSVLIAVSVFSSIRRVAWAALRGIGDRRCAVTATSIAAAVNLGAAWFLIPVWGTWGAVAANSGAQLLATLWALVVMSRSYGFRFPMLQVSQIAAAGMFALGATLTVSPHAGGIVGLALAIAAGAGTFVVVAVLLGVIGPREWSFFLGSVRRLTARPAPQAGARAA